MSDVVNAIGLVSGILTIVGFFQSNFPGKADEGPTVRIKAGLHKRGEEDASLAGSISHVWSFDERNGYGGQSDGCHIDAGGICDKTVPQDVGGRRAGYISVASENDATCISWISVEQFDGTTGGAWTGDIGRACGADWYESQESAGKLDNGEQYVPSCTWLDGDHTNEIEEAAMKFDVNAYGEKVQDTVDNSRQCGATMFGPDNGPIAGVPGARRKRSNTERPDWMMNQLVMSNWTTQSAAGLCESATSWGPDFIDANGQFCDMGTKTLLPLCSKEDVDGCVVVDETEGKLMKRMRVAKRATDVVHKSYKEVSKWGQ